MGFLDKLSHWVSDGSRLSSQRLMVFVLAPDVFDLSLNDGCLQENENATENGINPELAKVGCINYASSANS